MTGFAVDYERLTHDPSLTAAEARLVDAYRKVEVALSEADAEVRTGQVRNRAAAEAAIAATRWGVIAAVFALDPSIAVSDAPAAPVEAEGAHDGHPDAEHAPGCARSDLHSVPDDCCSF